MRYIYYVVNTFLEDDNSCEFHGEEDSSIYFELYIYIHYELRSLLGIYTTNTHILLREPYLTNFILIPWIP